MVALEVLWAPQDPKSLTQVHQTGGHRAPLCHQTRETPVGLAVVPQREGVRSLKEGSLLVAPLAPNLEILDT